MSLYFWKERITVRSMLEYEKDLVPIVRLICYYPASAVVQRKYLGFGIIEIHLLLRSHPLCHHTHQANLPGEKTKLSQHLLHRHLLLRDRLLPLPRPQLLLCCPAELVWWPPASGGDRRVCPLVHVLLRPWQLPGLHQYWHDLHKVRWYFIRREGVTVRIGLNGVKFFELTTDLGLEKTVFFLL